jgi:hypothetical protein
MIALIIITYVGCFALCLVAFHQSNRIEELRRRIADLESLILLSDADLTNNNPVTKEEFDELETLTDEELTK